MFESGSIYSKRHLSNTVAAVELNIKSKLQDLSCCGLIRERRQANYHKGQFPCRGVEYSGLHPPAATVAAEACRNFFTLALTILTRLQRTMPMKNYVWRVSL